MRKCNVVPYEGDEPYVFISYSHKDIGRVFPVLEYLASLGVRIWFDNGIHPGTDWIETIGHRLDNCAVFIPFISNNSLSSHNCKNELNFAIMDNKPALSVVLEPVEYSMALKMQMASIQGIMRYEYQNYEDYLESFLRASCLDVCKGEPNPDIVISEESLEEPETVSEPRKSSIEWLKDSGSDEGNPSSSQAGVSEAVKEDDDETTVYIDDDDEETRLVVPSYFLVRDDTGEKIDITHDDFKIGRKKLTCDYAIDDPLRKVSREHVSFFVKDDKCMVKDNGTPNHTYLNGVQLTPQDLYQVDEGDKITLASDRFTFTLGMKLN